MKHAGIYWRAGKLFVHSKHGMASGLRAQDDSVAVTEGDLEGIGAAIRSKLESYLDGAPVPRWDLMRGDQYPKLHAAAAVRSSAEFTKGAKYVSAQLENGQITLIPWKNERGREGFSPLRGRDHSISEQSSDFELGTAVMAAVGDAE